MTDASEVSRSIRIAVRRWHPDLRPRQRRSPLSPARHPRIRAVQGLQPRPHVRQTDARSRLAAADRDRTDSRRRWRSVPPTCSAVDSDRAALEHVRDAVRHRVLDDRLQQQRRHQARAGVAGADVDAAADRRSGRVRSPGTARRAASSRSSVMRASDPSARLSRRKSAEQQAHAAAPGRIGRRQRADGVQAVEQEMRIDLRAQRSQLGLAREHLDLQRLAAPPAATLRTPPADS